MKKNIQACESHIEILIDSYLDDFEIMPIIKKNEDLNLHCSKCDNLSLYTLLESDVKTQWQ